MKVVSESHPARKTSFLYRDTGDISDHINKRNFSLIGGTPAAIEGLFSIFSKKGSGRKTRRRPAGAW